MLLASARCYPDVQVMRELLAQVKIHKHNKLLKQHSHKKYFVLVINTSYAVVVCTVHLNRNGVATEPASGPDDDFLHIHLCAKVSTHRIQAVAIVTCSSRQQRLPTGAVVPL